MKVFVVTAVSGDREDRLEWIVAVYFKSLRAELHKERANKFVRDHSPKLRERREKWSGGTKYPQFPPSPFDPALNEGGGETDTNYFVRPVELRTDVPVSPAPKPPRRKRCLLPIS